MFVLVRVIFRKFPPPNSVPVFLPNFVKLYTPNSKKLRPSILVRA